jgi:hypothetical protein
MLCQALLVFHVVVCCATQYTKTINFFHVWQRVVYIEITWMLISIKMPCFV